MGGWDGVWVGGRVDGWKRGVREVGGWMHAGGRKREREGGMEGRDVGTCVKFEV